jgi:hypothetical protein
LEVKQQEREWKMRTQTRLRHAIIQALKDDGWNGNLYCAAQFLDEMDETLREEVLKAIGRNVMEHIRNEVRPLGEILSNSDAEYPAAECLGREYGGEASAQIPGHLAIQWHDEETGCEPWLWSIYDTTVDLNDDRMRDHFNGGLLIYGIETREEAERIMKTELKNHVPANIRWFRPTGKPTP